MNICDIEKEYFKENAFEFQFVVLPEKWYKMPMHTSLFHIKLMLRLHSCTLEPSDWWKL